MINLSLGSEVPLIGATGGDAFDAAVHRAIAAGIVVVAAAGNNGVPVCEQPAAGDGLLCVGAVDKRQQRSFFSSFGSGLGLVAPGGSGGSATGMPGEDVLSTFKGSAYEALAGTSQAAPHVSGVAALLVARGVRGQAAVKRILATATDLGTPGTDPEYGAGLVNARAAVAGLGGGAARRRHARPAPTAPLRAFVRVKRRQRARGVLRRGIRLRVRVVRAGRVRVRVRVARPLIARGSRKLRAERAATVVARLNAARPPAGAARPAVPGARAGAAAGRAPRPRAQDPRALTRRTLDRVPEPLTHRPDVLVLAAGGTLGEAWMRGLLDGAGAATGIDFRDCEYFVGTSAGSIVAAFLAAGREPDSGAEARAARDWSEAAGDAGNGAGGPWMAEADPADAEGGPLAALGRLGRTAAAPFAPLALAAGAPGGAVARAAALAAVPRGKRSMPGLGRLVGSRAPSSTGGCGSPPSTAAAASA